MKGPDLEALLTGLLQREKAMAELVGQIIDELWNSGATSRDTAQSLRDVLAKDIGGPNATALEALRKLRDVRRHGGIFET